jgi:hypothetical protein
MDVPHIPKSPNMETDIVGKDIVQLCLSSQANSIFNHCPVILPRGLCIQKNKYAYTIMITIPIIYIGSVSMQILLTLW